MLYIPYSFLSFLFFYKINNAKLVKGAKMITIPTSLKDLAVKASDIKSEDYLNGYYLINNFPIMKNDLIMIYGKNGSGKTMLAIYTALNFLLENKDKKVLFLNANEPMDIIVSRFAKLAEDNLLDEKEIKALKDNLFFISDTKLDFNNNDIIKTLTDFDLVIIDDLVKFIDFDELNHSKVYHTLMDIRRICMNNNISVVFTHYADNKGNCRGSYYFYDVPAMVYKIKGTDYNFEGNKKIIEKIVELEKNKYQYDIKPVVKNGYTYNIEIGEEIVDNLDLIELF